MKTEKCCFCKKPITGYGNNPAPVKESGRCCDECNLNIVIPARLMPANATLRWAVYAKCEAKNNGKDEKFNRLIAVFEWPFQAEDFIKKCLPPENFDRFKVVDLLNEIGGKNP